jgi:hypothetical protein
MRSPQWVALPLALLVSALVLIGLRIRIVRDRTGDWAGEGCVVGPYNPAERTYLFAITAVLAVAALTAILVIVRTRSARSRITAIVVVLICVIGALYLATVWGGLEYNNRPVPELPCPDPAERGV